MPYWLAGERLTGFRLENFIQRGQESISFSNQQAFTHDVMFAVPFANAPIITATIASGAGAAARWSLRVTGVTTTGFTIVVTSPTSGATGTWSGVEVNWIAVAP